MKLLRPAEEPLRPEVIGGTSGAVVGKVIAGTVLYRVSVTKTILGEVMVNMPAERKRERES